MSRASGHRAARIGALVVALALAACSTTPPQRELPPLPQAWFGPAGAAPDAADAAQLAQWWRQFDDPLLHELMDTALSRNLDVQSALADLRRARAQLRGASAALWPVLDGSGQASRQWIDLSQAAEGEDNPLAGLVGDGDTALDTWQLALQASWELDLFGANRLRREAGALRLGAAQAQIVATRLAVAGNLAQGYVQARGLLGQLALLDAGVDNAAGLERIARARFELGEVTRLDVEAAGAQRAALQAQRGELESALADTTFALDTLIDHPPGTTRTLLGETGTVPLAGAAAIPAGQPLDLLRRRPDLIAAVAELDAAERNALASRRDLFPKLAVSASYGRSGLALGDALSGASTLRNAAAQLAFPWLDFGASRAAIDEADAQADAGFVGVRQAIGKALEEVEVADAQRDARTRQLQHRQDALARGEEALRMARRTYEIGLSDLDAVLNAEEGALQARRDLLETTMALAGAQIALYTALGGGWQVDPAAGGLESVDRELQRRPAPDRIRTSETSQ